MTHTPGPWISDLDDDDGRYTIIAMNVKTSECDGLESQSRMICTILDTDPESQHDANLIAAAPAMLEALKACVRLIQSYENPQNIVTSVQLDALKAIAQAEGK